MRIMVEGNSASAFPSTAFQAIPLPRTCRGEISMRIWWRSIVLLLALIAAPPLQAAEPSPELRARAAELVALFKGEAEPERLFSPAFLRQVPPSEVNAISGRLQASHGGVRGLESVEARGSAGASVALDFESAVVRFDMVIEPVAPHRIAGLVVAGVESKAESVGAVFGELVGLPGEVSLAASRLEEAGPVDFLTQKAGRPLAIGSTFKLFILAELARAVKAGERRWTDVVPLTSRSLPSGLLHDWPKGSPLTLHSLATLMISRSDNSAADTLLALLGRDKVEQVLPLVGVAEPERNRPFLSSREAFALKLGDPALPAQWAAADEAGRRALLPRLGAIDPATLDPARLTGAPNAIGSAEWFASPADLVRTLDWLRRNGDSTLLDILAVNPGLGRSAADRFAYLGFKGGSEPGVISMSFLVRRKAGNWIALSVGWNNPAEPLDEAKFIALVARLVALMR